jgi:hypothetical protein
MKTKSYYLLTLAVMLTATFALSNSFIGVEAAYAQLQPTNNEITDGNGGNGGSEGCSGTTCDDANGLKYGTITYNGVTHCCGATSSSPGNKSS